MRTIIEVAFYEKSYLPARWQNLCASVFKILHKHERTGETMHNMAKWMKLKTAKEENTQHLPTNEIKTPCKMSEKL